MVRVVGDVVVVDAITRAHEQYLLRNPVWQRLLAVLLYLLGLVTGIVALPIVAIGPERPARLLPEAWQPTVRPVLDLLLSPPVIGLVLVLALATLYKIALPLKPPWWRGLPGALLAAAVFLLGATGLRVYLDWLTSTGYTYGALAAPIAFLLGTFFIGLAIVLGAHLNASIQALWPVKLRDRRNRLGRASEKVSAAPADAAAPTGAGIAAAAGSVTPDELPDVLLSPDVAVLERAVRERPDVAAAVLNQMHYGQLHPTAPHPGNGAVEPVDERGDGRSSRDGPDRVGVIAADGRRTRGAIVGHGPAGPVPGTPARGHRGGRAGVEALTALVAALLGRLHGVTADAVCPGGWPWAVSLLGVAVGLVPAVGAAGVALWRRRIGSRYGPAESVVLAGTGLLACGVVPLLVFLATGRVFTAAAGSGRVPGLTARQLRDLDSAVCVVGAQSSYLGRGSVAAAFTAAGPVRAGLAVLALAGLPAVVALFTAASARLALRRGPRWPARFFWLPVLAVAVLTTDVPAGSAAHLWLGASAGALLGMPAVLALGAPGWAVVHRSLAARPAGGAPSKQPSTRSSAPGAGGSRPGPTGAAAVSGAGRAAPAAAGGAAVGADRPGGFKERLASRFAARAPEPVVTARGSGPASAAGRWCTPADPRRPGRCAGWADRRSRGRWCPGPRTEHRPGPVPAACAGSGRAVRAGVARPRRPARAHGGAQGGARARRGDRGADPPRGPRAGDRPAPALRADPRPRARRQRPGPGRARRHGDRDGVRARRVAR